MSEGLPATEVGKELSQHAGHGRTVHDRRDRTITILEAALLALVTLIAAWSGYAAAKWNTKSRVELAEASTARTEANRAAAEALTTRNFDSRRSRPGSLRTSSGTSAP